MLKPEAEWLAQAMYSLDAQEVFPLLNIGSSTYHYRTKVQPWIDQNLFEPARHQNCQVIHSDIKGGEGVDIAGDLCDPEFLKQLSQLKIKSILCANLLEHIPNRVEICNVLDSILPEQGYLLITVPYQYPYHPDPIDTLFRPDVDELKQLFPTMKVVSGKIVDGGGFSRKVYFKGLLLPSYLYPLCFALRLFIPFYKPKAWFYHLKTTPWFFKRVAVTCVVLQKLPVTLPSSETTDVGTQKPALHLS
ncbi:MAG: hypothetical protein MUC48_02290 [Leptolyngbya sp. Prado105]|jgi:hypothetical protein|nr:hypothetical protein [Leptolyngbya sp. Prado105]